MNPRTYSAKKKARKLKQIKRSGPIARGARPRSSNPKRKAREKLRAYGEPAHREWLHKQRCCITFSAGSPSNPIVAAHTKGDGGMGRKASARYQVPMLDSLHRELHQYGAATFQVKYDVDLDATAAHWWGAWLASQGETP